MISEEENEYPNLMQLAKIYYFRKFLSNQIKKEHQMMNKTTPLILIPKNIINEYLGKYDFENLSKFLFDNITDIDYNSLYNNYGKIIHHLKTNKNQLYEKIKQNEKLSPFFNFTAPEYYLKQETYKNGNGKLLYYISEFEIIDESIYSFFKEKQIIQKDQVIKGKYIANGGKILINYKYNGKNYYKIGSIDFSNNFILEYILEENSNINNKIIDYFDNMGIIELIKLLNDNKISYGYQSICYCYEFKPASSIKENEVALTNEDNQYNINKILTTLINLNIFETSVKSKLELSETKLNDLNSSVTSNPFSTMQCKLVSKTFIDQIKQLFDYSKINEIVNIYQLKENTQTNEEKLNQILSNNEVYKKFLLDKKSDFLQLKNKAKQFCINEKESFQKETRKFRYPKNFNILEKNLFNDFTEVFELKEEDIPVKPEEILLTYNSGKIIFRGLNEKFLW